jgi:hypothetical protein
MLQVWKGWDLAKRASVLGNSVGRFEEFVNEPILTPLPLSHRTWPFRINPESFVAQPEIRETLAWRSLAVRSRDGPSDDIVQILDGSVAAASAEYP